MEMHFILNAKLISSLLKCTLKNSHFCWKYKKSDNFLSFFSYCPLSLWEIFSILIHIINCILNVFVVVYTFLSSDYNIFRTNKNFFSKNKNFPPPLNVVFVLLSCCFHLSFLSYPNVLKE